MSRGQADLEGHGRAPRQAIVLLEIDRLFRDLLHVESPQEAGDGEPDLALGDDHARADTAAIISRLVG